MPEDRELDLVLFGATGFTGRPTAEYLAQHAPSGLRWALAGRSPDRLSALRDRLAELSPAAADVPLLAADVSDPTSLADLAERTRAVITTVGPFLEYGEPMVAACAEAGTDYVDATGESEFVDRMYLAHHATAERTGARLVHACGFDSVPHDLGAYFTVRRLSPDAPITMRGVVRASATWSSGTMLTALNAMSRRHQARSAAAQRRRVEPRPEGRSARAVAGRPHRDSLLGYWLLPLPTLDPVVVARSGRALPAYGPEFRYTHYAGTRSLRYAVGGAAVVASVGVAAQIGPLRERLEHRFEAGDGPSESRRERSWFTVDFVAESEGHTVHTRVSGGDPGYGETPKMLVESALSLLLDDNPDTAGQVTTAVAMGDSLTERLRRAGIRFEVVSDDAETQE